MAEKKGKSPKHLELVNRFHLNKEQINFIKKEEGTVLEVYLDSVNKPTTGTGRLLQPDTLRTGRIKIGKRDKQLFDFAIPVDEDGKVSPENKKKFFEIKTIKIDGKPAKRWVLKNQKKKLNILDTDILFRQDLKTAQNVARQSFPHTNLNKRRETVLVGLAFNLPPEAFKEENEVGFKQGTSFPGFTKAVRQGDWKRAAFELGDSKRGKIQLPRRTRKEQNLLFENFTKLPKKEQRPKGKLPGTLKLEGEQAIELQPQSSIFPPQESADIALALPELGPGLVQAPSETIVPGVPPLGGPLPLIPQDPNEIPGLSMPEIQPTPSAPQIEEFTVSPQTTVVGPQGRALPIPTLPVEEEQDEESFLAGLGAVQSEEDAFLKDLGAISSDQMIVKPPEVKQDLSQAFVAGVKKQIIPRLAKQAIELAPGTQQLRERINTNLRSVFNPQEAGELTNLVFTDPDEEFVPQTTAEKAIVIGAQLFDPAFLLLDRGSAAMAAKAAKSLGLVDRSIQLTAQGKRLQSLIRATKDSGRTAETMNFKLRGLQTLEKEIFASTAANEMQQTLLRGLSTGAGVETGLIGVEFAESGELDPNAAKRIAAGAGAGGLLFAGGKAALRGLGAARKNASKTLSDKLKRLFPEKPTVKPESLEAAMQDISTKVRKLKAQGRVTDEKAILDRITREELFKRKIIVPETEVDGPSLFNAFTNQTERADKVDRVFGTRLTSIIDGSIRANFRRKSLINDFKTSFLRPVRELQKLGVTKQEITELMQHVETADNGVIFFNPRKAKLTKKYNRSQYKGWNPDTGEIALPGSDDAAVREQLWEIRKVFNNIVKNDPVLREEMGFINGYVPLLERKTIRASAPSRPGSLNSAELARFQKHRTATGFNSKFFEDDFEVLVDYYSHAAAKTKAYRSLLKDTREELAKLYFLGQDKTAQRFGRVMAQNMGLKDVPDLNRIYGDKLVEAHRTIIQDVARQTADPDAFQSQAFNFLKKQTNLSLVFTKFPILFKQYLQPRLVAGAEIGQKYVGKGVRAWKNKEARAIAEGSMDEMRSVDPNMLAEIEFDNITNKWLRRIDVGLEVPTKPIKHVFNKLDIRNRGVVFLGAREQWDDLIVREGAERIMDGMLEGEKNIIRRLLRTQGNEAAKNMYAMIRSRRANFAYALADTPTFFRGDIGRLIPFTTWGRNQLARIIGDVRDRNVRKLAQRAVQPLIILELFNLLTGHRISGAHPWASLPSAVGTNVLPSLGETMRDVSFSISREEGPIDVVKGVAKRQSQRFVSPFALGKTVERTLSAEGLEKVGLRKLKPNSTINKLRKEILKNLK